MVLSEKIKIVVNPKTMSRYKALGYDADRVGKVVEISYKDLSKYSEEKIMIRCDYCGNTFEKKYGDYLRSTRSSKIDKDACYGCRVAKSQESILASYGVANPFSIQSVKEKSAFTMIERYGVDNPSKSQFFQNKKKQTQLDRYGVDSASKLDSVKQKVVATNNAKYGVDYYQQTGEYKERAAQTCHERYGARTPFESSVIQAKIKDTLIERYGTPHALHVPEFVHKALRKRWENSNNTCSAQQYSLYKLIGGELNYPIGKFVIDIAFVREKIAIEYDGSGHDLSVRLGHITRENFNRNAIFRKKYLHQEDWKIITFISSKDLVPLNAGEYIRVANEYFNLGGHWIEFHIDTHEIKTSKGTTHNQLERLNEKAPYKNGDATV